LRIALLAMNDSADGDNVPVMGALDVAGASLARHQLTLVQALDCQRVICLAARLSPEVVALQHAAESQGMQFHAVRDARGLPALVSASDEVFALAEGLLLDPASAAGLLGGGEAVLVVPADSGVPAGFERIDLNNANAGAIRIPGRLVDGLADLPPDCAVLSALTRLALQGGIPMREVPPDLRSGVRWRKVRNEREAAEAEREWIRLHISDRLTPTPGSEVARLGIGVVGPALLRSGRASQVGLVAALGGLALALVLGWFGFTAAGLAMCGLASFAGLGTGMLQQIEQAAGGKGEEGLPLETSFTWLLDLVLVALMIWHEPLQPWENMADRAFVPIMLLLVVRIASQLCPRNLAAWLKDRAVLSAMLGIAAAFGLLMPIAQGLSILISLIAIGLGNARSRIT
jgi:hypothetical protein